MSDQAPAFQVATLLKLLETADYLCYGLHELKPRESFLVSRVALACLGQGGGALSGLRREWAELIQAQTERTALKALQTCVDGGWLIEEPEKRSKQGAVVKTYRPGPKLIEDWNRESAREARAERGLG